MEIEEAYRIMQGPAGLKRAHEYVSCVRLKQMKWDGMLNGYRLWIKLLVIFTL